MIMIFIDAPDTAFIIHSQPDFLQLSSYSLPQFTGFQMNHQTLFFSPFINLCILIVFVISETSFAVDFYYQNCSVPTTCGGQDISFPFFIKGQQQPFCGYPGFQLSCNEEVGYPVLQLAGNDYLIHNISYQNQTLIVSNAVFSDSGGCLLLVQNITYPIDRYKLAPNQKEIILLYNCNSSLVDESFSEYKIGCFEALSGAITSVLALPLDEHQLFNNVSDKCGREAMVAPVEGYASKFGNELGVEVALRRGFMLTWLASNCSRCELSGGRCGYFESYFSCFCPDRPHEVRCQGDENENLGLKLGLGAVAGAVAVVIIICCLFWKKHQNRQTVEDFLRNYGPLQVKRYSYSDVKKMTNSFKKKLGQGGYGGVYKGKLKTALL